MLKSIFKILFFLTVTSYSQENKNDFPKSFLGVYKGELTIIAEKGEQKIPMEFHLKKTADNNKYSYVLIYDGNARNYTLILKDIKKGIFDLDENNGIILPTKYSDNTLYSFFEVQDSFLSSRLHFEKNALNFEILFSNLKNKVTSGGQSKEIPKVFGYPISTVQKARLLKQSN